MAACRWISHLGRDQLWGPPRQAGEMLHKLATYAAEGFSEGDRNRSGPFVVIGETNCFPDTLLRAAGLERDPRLVVIPAGVAAGLAPGHGPFHHLDDFQNGWYLSDHLQRLLSPISDSRP